MVLSHLPSKISNQSRHQIALPYQSISVQSPLVHYWHTALIQNLLKINSNETPAICTWCTTLTPMAREFTLWRQVFFEVASVVEASSLCDCSASVGTNCNQKESLAPSISHNPEYFIPFTHHSTERNTQRKNHRKCSPSTIFPRR